jgi:hypothetical protein
MDPVEPLDREAREMLAAYRRERPSGGARARNWSAVRGRVEPERERAPRGRASVLWFGALSFALAAAILLLVRTLLVALQPTEVERDVPPAAADELPAPPLSPTIDMRHVPSPGGAAAAPIEPAAAPSDPPLQRPRRVAPAGTPEAPEDTLGAENELLGRARRELTEGHDAAGLELLAEHAQRFPKSALAEDRAALRTIALCRTASADAKAAVREFGSRYPGSHHHRSIKVACDGATDTPAP